MRHQEKRNMLSDAQVSGKSEKIMERFLALPEAQKAKTVMAYVGVKKEAQTTELIRRLLREGKRVLVPVTDFKKKELVPSEIFGIEDLELKGFGLMEPKESALRPVPLGQIGLIVVPGVSFDACGGRIGSGYGFYDKMLRKISTKVTLVGFCFEENLDERLPCESHDVRMNLVVTEARAIRCK